MPLHHRPALISFRSPVSSIPSTFPGRLVGPQSGVVAQPGSAHAPPSRLAHVCRMGRAWVVSPLRRSAVHGSVYRHHRTRVQSPLRGSAALCCGCLCVRPSFILSSGRASLFPPGLSTPLSTCGFFALAGSSNAGPSLRAVACRSPRRPSATAAELLLLSPVSRPPSSLIVSAFGFQWSSASILVRWPVQQPRSAEHPCGLLGTFIWQTSLAGWRVQIRSGDSRRVAARSSIDRGVVTRSARMPTKRREGAKLFRQPPSYRGGSRSARRMAFGRNTPIMQRTKVNPRLQRGRLYFSA